MIPPITKFQAIYSFIAKTLLLLPLTFFSINSIANAATDNMKVEAYEAVQSFCKLEFDGAQDADKREKTIRFTDGRQSEMSKHEGPANPYDVEWQYDPIDVVRSYKVNGVTIHANKATAIIEYDVVAQRNTAGAKIQGITEHSKKIQVELAFTESKWMVINPTNPKVSIDALSQAYRKLFGQTKTWYENVGVAEFLRLRDAIDNIILLEKLDTQAEPNAK